MTIHPTAQVDATAKLGKDVDVGPYSIIEAHVTIGDRSRVGSHVLIAKRSQIGSDCEIGHGVVIGTPPQDVAYQGEPTRVVVGNHVVIREYATINRSTGPGTETRIGDHCMILIGAHVGHNGQLGQRVTLTNQVCLGGYVQIGSDAVIGGLTGVHQFVRVGEAAMVGGCSKLTQDVLPYCLCDGNPARLAGLNRVGLKRLGVAQAAIEALRQAYQIIVKQELPRDRALHTLRPIGSDSPEMDRFIQFLDATSKKGVLIKTREKTTLLVPH